MQNSWQGLYRQAKEVSSGMAVQLALLFGGCDGIA